MTCPIVGILVLTTGITCLLLAGLIYAAPWKEKQP